MNHTKKSAPKVSIITPTKNRFVLLREAIDSVRSQTYTNWELIVVDDDSNDETAQLMFLLCDEDRRIRFIKRSGSLSGAPVCRNQGLQASTGDYIIFLDSDDLLAPYCLEQRICFFLNNPEYDFLVFSMLIFCTQMGDTNIMWNIKTDENDLTRFLSFDTPWQTICPIWKKKVFEVVGLWDEKILTWQDWEFHIRCLSNNLNYFKPDALPDCFLRRDDSPDRISAGDLQDERFLSRLETFGKVFCLLDSCQKLSRVNQRGLAGRYFHDAEIACLLNKLEILSLFIRSLESKKLLDNKTLVIVKLYFKIISQIKKHRASIIISLVYRIGKIFLPSYLSNKNSNLFKHSLVDADIEIVRKLVHYDGE